MCTYSHQFRGITANWVKLQACGAYKVLKYIMSCYAYTMTDLLQLLAKCYKWLNVAYRSINTVSKEQIRDSNLYFQLLE